MQHIDDSQIATAAYNLWLAEGQPHGQDQDHWLRARTTLEAAAVTAKQRATKPAAKTVTKAKAAATPRKTKAAAATAKPRKSAKPRKADV